MRNIIADPNALNSCRLKKGYSMRKLSRVADIDVLTVHRIETQKTKYVTPNTANKICNALGVEFDDLFEITESKEA